MEGREEKKKVIGAENWRFKNKKSNSENQKATQIIDSSVDKNHQEEGVIQTTGGGGERRRKKPRSRKMAMILNAEKIR